MKNILGRISLPLFFILFGVVSNANLLRCYNLQTTVDFIEMTNQLDTDTVFLSIDVRPSQYLSAKIPNEHFFKAINLDQFRSMAQLTLRDEASGCSMVVRKEKDQLSMLKVEFNRCSTGDTEIFFEACHFGREKTRVFAPRGF